MTFLPIIERELRVRSRNRATWWIRFGAGLAGVLICIPPFTYSLPFATPGSVGRGVFNGLVIGAFLLCLGACLLTAEAVGSERREGTLGLLLLTRVRILDLLVGKLGSVGLVGFCALLAFLPMLMIPVLDGGVTGGEAARVALSLVNVLFFALAAGLYAAAAQSDRFRAARRAILTVAAFALVPLLLAWMIAWGNPGSPARWIATLSPIGALKGGSDAAYKASAASYWVSMSALVLFSGAFLGRASVRLRRTVREETSPRGNARTKAAGVAYVQPRTGSRRRAEIEMAPVEWLVRRQRGVAAMMWAAALLALLHFGLLLSSLRLGLPASVYLFVSIIEATLFAWAASRFFFESRRSAELEVLLTTPVGARVVVSAQWHALKRLIRWPLVVMTVPLLIFGVYQGFFSVVGRGLGSYGPWLAALHVISPLAAALKMVSLCWLGMWFGLTSSGQARAILVCVGLTTGLPYLSHLLFSSVSRKLLPPFGGEFLFALWLLPYLVDVVFYLWLIAFARGRLAQGVTVVLSNTQLDALP